MANLCINCKIREKINTHSNTKYCKHCREAFVNKPRHNLTLEQQAIVRKLAGTMYYEKLAKFVGCSRSSISRFARQEGVSLNAHKYKKELVDQVIAYYEKHGKTLTQQMFPNVKIRSIVEKHEHNPRQVKWTFEHKKELLKMAGLISFKNQARFFNRPRANEGSIKSAFAKRVLPVTGSNINGMNHNKAIRLVKSTCPFYKRTMVRRVKSSTCIQQIALWVDIEDHLKDSIPESIREAIAALALFQRKLHDAKTNAECREKIKLMFSERDCK